MSLRIYFLIVTKLLSCRKAVATASVVDNLAVYVAQDCTGETDEFCFKNLYEGTRFQIF